MLAAGAWSIPPWEITGEPVTTWTRQKWLMRYSWVNTLYAKVKKAKAKVKAK